MNWSKLSFGLPRGPPRRALSGSAGVTARASAGASWLPISSSTTSGPSTVAAQDWSTRPKRSRIHPQASGGASTSSRRSERSRARSRSSQMRKVDSSTVRASSACTRDHMCSNSSLTAASTSSSLRESDGSYSKEGRGKPGSATITHARVCFGQLVAIGGKIQERTLRAYTSALASPSDRAGTSRRAEN